MNRKLTYITVLLIGGAFITAAHADGYPQWRNDGSGSAADSGVKLIEDISQAKLAWESEAELPRVFGDGHGGFAGPSVGEGKVFIQYYCSGGAPYDRKFYEEKVAVSRDPSTVKLEDFWIRANDVVVCMDAKTGKTLWKQTFERKGVNVWYNGGVMYTQPCVRGGRVYIFGSLARVYCLDAQTGKVLWEFDKGAGFAHASKLLDDWLSTDDPFSPEHHPLKARKVNWQNAKTGIFGEDGYQYFVGSPQAAGDPKGGQAGVLILNDAVGGLLALDLVTGQERWHRSASGTWKGAPAIVTRQSPTIWKQGDRWLIACNTQGGNIECSDALTGKVVWAIEGAGSNGGNGPCVANDVMVVFGPIVQVDGKVSKPLVGYALQPDGAEKIWQVDPARFVTVGNTTGWWPPVIHHGHVYAIGEKGELGCIDLKTGAVKGVIDAKLGEGVTAPIAGDGRIFHHWSIFKADPTDFRLFCKGAWLSTVKEGPLRYPDREPQPIVPIIGTNQKIWMTDGTLKDFPVPVGGAFNPNVYAGGFYYYRGPNRLYCVDLRKQ